MKCIFSRVALVTFLAALSGCGRPPAPVAQARTSPPPAVPVLEATPAEVSTSIDAVALVEGSANRDIHSPEAGYVIHEAYPEGALVREGDMLFEIDTNPRHAQPGSASAEMKITSPIDGMVARAIPGVGDWIKPETILTVVSAVDPVVAHFTVPRKVYRDHAAWFTQLLARPRATWPENVRLTGEDGAIYPKLGKLSSIDSEPPTPSDPVTVSAQFANPEHALKPGEYVRVRLIIGPTAAAPQSSAPSPP